MRFVTIRNEALGRVASVPESRVPHLSDGWQVVTETPDINPAVDDAPAYEPAADSGEEQPTHHRAGSRSRQKES